MIKKIFSALVVVLFATSMMAQSGLTCEEPIPVNKDYRGYVDGPCELWYTANTFDLPLHVYFSPVSDNSEFGPEVEVDFTCTSGVYDDPKLDSLINMVSDFDITFPVEFMSELVVRNNRNEWDLSVSKSYRDQLADFGITYPVQAFVKVRYFEAGNISLTPDTLFSSCMDNAEKVALGDTITIDANNTDRVFVFPYTEWQEDSIRFVWSGDGTAQVYVAVQECEFTPEADNPYVFDNFAIMQDVPHKMYSESMKAVIKEQKEGGVYFAKVVASGSGELVVEKIPMSAIEGGAIVLEHGQTVEISSSFDQLYCFPKTWTATQILAMTSQPMTMYISNVADFVVGDNSVLSTCVASLEDAKRAIYLSGKEISNLVSKATGDYLYVRFSCASSAELYINAWEASECADESVLLAPNTPQFVAARSSAAIYRVRYTDFSGSPLTVKWNSSDKLLIYIAETCDFLLTTNNEVLLLNPAPSIAKGGELLLEATEIDAWASRIADDGYFYVRLDSKRAGEITLATEKVEETPVTPDPVYTTIDATLCYGEVYEWNGQTYTATGEYTQTLVAANGADSIVTLNLTIRPEVAAVEEKATVCYGESYTWQGTTYTETGEYSTTLQDENGCDYQAVLSLTVLPKVADTTETAEVPFGETYTWHGTTYAESGSYTITLQDANGCDYQATLHLTVLPEPEKTDLLPNDALSVSLPTALNVYAMDYAAWKAQDVKWQWTGSTPLYVFVAKSSDYALTPQNRHVLLFAPIEPGEEIVLTKEQVSAWESLAEGGMIYVRLLTEKSGQLTTVAE